MSVMFAKSYVLQMSDNVKRSLEQARKEGFRTNLAPLGYLKARLRKEQDQIQRLSKMYDDRYGNC